MEFPFAQAVTRQRRQTTASPYNPSKTVPGDWTNPSELTLTNAFVASSSTAGLTDAARAQIITRKSLYLGDPAQDVKPGDRIVDGADIYEVDAMPAADTNPFTGWTPVKEIPLKGVVG